MRKEVALQDEPIDAHISKNVKDMMSRHNIGKRSYATELTKILNIKYVQAYRKMNALSSWLVYDLERIANYFNEPMSRLVEGGNGNAKEATITIGFRDLPCLIWLSDNPAEEANQSEIVATNEEKGWRVIESSEIGDKKVFGIKRIEISPKSIKKYKIALLDDDIEFTDSMKIILNRQGFITSTYCTINEYISAINNEDFDALIVDWSIENRSDDELLREIRHTKDYNEKPIILITCNTPKYAQAIAKAIRQLNLIYISKPTMGEIIAAQLRAKLE